MTCPTPPRKIEPSQWSEICAQLRATDDISFKLLGFVPLLTVAGIAVVLLKFEAVFSPALIVVCIVGSAYTIGFWVWERRNIQTCNWLRNTAENLEREAYGPLYAERFGQFAGFPKKGPRGLGKTDGERIVYATTLGAWLIVPLAMFTGEMIGERPVVFLAYLLAGGMMGYLGFREIFFEPIAAERSNLADSLILEKLNRDLVIHENSGDQDYFKGRLAEQFSMRNAKGEFLDRDRYFERIRPGGDRITAAIDSITFLGHERAAVQCKVTAGGSCYDNFRLFVRQPGAPEGWVLVAWANEKVG